MTGVLESPLQFLCSTPIPLHDHWGTATVGCVQPCGGVIELPVASRSGPVIGGGAGQWACTVPGVRWSVLASHACNRVLV